MDAQANVEVWRKIWRRFWFDDYFNSREVIKVWRKVWRRVPVNYSPPATYPAPSTDPQLITYADCEAFFETVAEGSRKDLLNILNIHGPEVITELSKSYNEHGETPLMVAIKRGNMDMVKYLVGKLDVPIGQIGRFMWKDVEYLDVPALYVAIVRGEMGIAAYLLSKEVGSNQTTEIIDSIISSPNERLEKINILELMGAANFYFYESHPAPQNGLLYWREAMNLRQSTVDGEPAIPKTIVPSDFAGMNFGFTSEFTTFEQLEQLPALDLFTQAVLVSKRVLDIVSPGPHIFTLTFLCQCASIYSSHEGQRGYAINVLTFFLQQSQELQWKEYKKSKIINWALDIMTRIIIDFRQKRLNPPGQEEFTFANLLATFDYLTSYMSVLLENHQQNVESDTLHNNLASCILEMIFLLNKMMPQLKREERQQFERSLSLFIRKDHRWGTANRNLLHMVCCPLSEMPPRMPHAGNDQLNDLIDNNADDLDFDSDTGSDLGFDSVSEFENDVESDTGSDPGSDLDGDLNPNSIEDDIGSVLEIDDADSDSNGDLNDDLGDDVDSDGDNSDASSSFSYETDVSGCPSCGYNGKDQRMSSDDESDDEDFELIRNHREEMLEIPNENDDNMATSAAEDLHISVTQLILRLGADPNVADLNGFTPLHLLAMKHGSVAQSRMLLDYGAHIDQPDAMSRTPLMHFQEWQRQLANQGNPDLNLQSLISYALPLPLSCLAARVLIKNQIPFPFDKEQVPSALHSFIRRR